MSMELERYIICQNITDRRVSKKLTDTDSGRRNLIKYLNTVQDKLLCGVDEHDLERIKYHVDTCYSTYKRKSDRANEKKLDCSASTSNSAENEEQAQETCPSSKRLRFDEKKSTNYYIICSKSECKGVTKLYRISEQHSSKAKQAEQNFCQQFSFQR